MGKRQVVVISSSEEEEEGRGGLRRRGRAREVAKSRSVSQKKPKRAGKRRASAPAYRDDEVNFESLSEDFYECFNEFGALRGAGKIGANELWVDKHKPRSTEDLAVHKKKVEEVRKWLEARMLTPKDEFPNNVLLIRGQAGVGKSIVVHAIASELGVELFEWKTPTPTLWQEHIHNSNSGLRFMSKLDEFEAFVEQSRKYPILPSKNTSDTRSSSVVLIDDLPLTNGRVSFGRLSRCLHYLVCLAQVPTIILMTQHSKDESRESTSGHWEELEASLERAGASKILFNPITENSIKRTISRICREENLNLSAEWIDVIAKSSGGDIRHAITSLQYFCLQLYQTTSPLSSTSSIHYHDKTCKDRPMPLPGVNVDDELCNRLSLSFGRDETLSLYHALGKFLHNKRETEYVSVPGPFLLKERLSRFPLKMDCPEKILSQAHGQARLIVDFLHENVHDFLDDEAISGAWAVASYLSDADFLLSNSVWTMPWKYEPEHLSQLVAASVAVRGVLFGNSQPSSRRWHSIRSPKLWQIEQSVRQEKKQIVMERDQKYSGFNSCSISIATEYRPTMKWLRSRASADVHLHIEQAYLEGAKVEYDSPVGLDVHNLNGSGPQEGSEDDIEEW